MSQVGLRLAALAVGALIFIAAVPASAAAATEFGDNCAANEAVEANAPATVVALSSPADPLPLTAPSAGVITRWTVHSALAITLAQTLKVLRPTGPVSVHVVGEATQTVSPGVDTMATRIPVQAGDRLALFAAGKTQIAFCSTPASKSKLAIIEGGAEVGSNPAFKEEAESEARMPISAVIEPDADGDGFGDETQDQCPQSAATQGPCPPPPPPPAPVALHAIATAGHNSVTVTLTAASQATVTVGGTVALGKGKSLALHGGTQVVAPGTLARFVLAFPQKLVSRLRQLSAAHTLSLVLTATAPNAGGSPSSTGLTVKLKGQAKPRHRRR